MPLRGATFDYSMYGNGMGDLKFYGSADCHNFTLLWSKVRNGQVFGAVQSEVALTHCPPQSGDQGPGWATASIEATMDYPCVSFIGLTVGQPRSHMAVDAVTFLYHFPPTLAPSGSPTPVPTVSSQPTSIPTAISCDPGFQLVDDTCYYFDATYRSYSDCATHCRGQLRVTDMLCVDDEAENDYIASEIEAPTWIDYNSENRGGCSSTYVRDIAGEPQTSHIQNFRQTRMHFPFLTSSPPHLREMCLRVGVDCQL